MIEENEIKAIVTLNRKIFHNGDDWGIFSVDLKENLENKAVTDYNNRITIKGNMPDLRFDTEYRIYGKLVEDKRYGKQYDIKNIAEVVQIDKNDVNSKKKYLESLFTKGQVEAMYEALNDPFQVLFDKNAVELVKVKGCGVNNANNWIDKFEKNYCYSKIFIELEEYGLTFNLVKKLYGIYGNPELVISKVKENPYTLTEIKGIGWKRADELALKSGLGLFSTERISSYICYYLEEAGLNGRSYIPAQELMDAIIENIGEEVPDINIAQAVRKLGDKLWYSEDKENIGLMSYYKLENNIAEEFHRLLTAENNFDYSNWETVIKELEEKQGWEFSEEQKQGILTALEKNVVIIEGKAGCGKTSVSSAFCKVLDNYPRALAALAGKAGARLAEVTGEEGYTIHRLLGFPNKNPDAKSMFTYNKDNPLPYDIYIIDEVSMIGGRLFLNLLRAIPSGSKLILLGDIGQLPSIGECNVAADIIESKHIPTVSLTQIHRQAAKSAIITDSIKARQGYQIIDKDWAGIETRGELQDFTIDCYSDRNNTYYKTLQHFSNDLQKVNSILDIQIIAPVKNQGDACTYSLNNAVQELYNPKDENKNEITCFSNGRPYVLREGDKIINNQNNYKVSSIDGESLGLFNGDIGIIHSINETGKIMEVDFVGKGRYIIGKDVISNIDLAYALTCHKMQGSQSERVIVAIDYSSFVLLSREWVYTAITRAQKHCTLVAQNSALRLAISKQFASNKTTHLVQALEDKFNPRLKF